ncbi:unnamed protein product [Lathyrus sativus]|nr:unnamed protein product [Lathyrus sativus]
MDPETRQKVEEMVLDILRKAIIEEATEFTVRLGASERLGIDLSDSHSRANYLSEPLSTLTSSLSPPMATNRMNRRNRRKFPPRQ